MPLTKEQAGQAVELIYVTAEILGHEIKPAAASMMVRDLRAHSLAEIDSALGRCRAELSGRLTLAAIIERIPSANAHLSGNEAWALALTTQDEQETVIWTPEIARALGVAQPVLDLGDKVGARMAFLGAYEREIQAAKAEGRPVTWQPTLGHDPARRQTVLEEAVAAGKLPAPRAAALLPPPDKPTTPAGLEKRQRALAMLRDVLAGNDRDQRDRAARFEDRRAHLLAQAGQGGVQ